jgi:molybdate transport system substrate-binding protein
MTRRLCGLLLLLVAISGCASATTRGGELVVFAAASLKEPLEQATAAYESGDPGTRLRLAFDSSASLRTQIEQGAPVDLFLSADLANPEKLVAAGIGRAPVMAFARNSLAIVVPTDNPAGIESPFDLAGDGVTIVAAGPEVPITVYAGQLIEQLAALDGAPQSFADGYAANVVSREDNVGAVVAKLELGEADAGIVYRTDAVASDKLRAIPLRAGASVVATYGGTVIDRSERAPEAQAFVAWLAGSEGQAILAGFGFMPVS